MTRIVKTGTKSKFAHITYAAKSAMHLCRMPRQAFLGVLVFMLFFQSMLLAGCSSSEPKENLTITGFAFDTTYTITLYEGGDRAVLDSCVQKCSKYEQIFSRTLDGSELYQVNELEKLYKEALYTEKEIKELTAFIDQKKSKKNILKYEIAEDGRMEIVISDMLRDIIKIGLSYSKTSDGSFDLTIEPLTSLWNFKAEEPVIPDKNKIREALPSVDYRKISLEGNRLIFQQAGMGIDLGGIAKGFIADDLKRFLKEQNVKGALISLGGNVLCLGGKSGNEKFNIGIQQPFAERNESIAAVAVQDLSVVSSGIYERYIQTEDGTMYHHILNPKTGYSYDNDLLGVTILSKESADGDGLSTTCFALGREKGMEYVDSLDGVYAMFITKDGKLWYSEGMKDFII